MPISVPPTVPSQPQKPLNIARPEDKKEEEEENKIEVPTGLDLPGLSMNTASSATSTPFAMTGWQMPGQMLPRPDNRESNVEGFQDFNNSEVHRGQRPTWQLPNQD